MLHSAMQAGPRSVGRALAAFGMWALHRNSALAASVGRALPAGCCTRESRSLHERRAGGQCPPYAPCGYRTGGETTYSRARFIGHALQRPPDLGVNIDTLDTMVYKLSVIQLIKSATFDGWLNGLSDVLVRARIQARLDRLALGNSGDVKPVGEGVSEMRIDIGPGYRVYFLRRGLVVVVLLCGGNKGTQARDIKTAKTIAAQWKG